ncbi:MAG: nucleoside recognition domain-containing protein, partial [Candidatus Aminicenantales bacterium]
IEIDAAKIERLLGVPVVPTIAAFGRGVSELLDRAFEVLDRGSSPRPLRFSGDVEDVVAEVERLMPAGFPVISSSRFTAVKLIETAGHACGDFLGEVEPGLRAGIDRARRALEAGRGAPAYEVISAERHHQAMKLAEETSRVLHGRRLTWDKRIDAVLMHPVFGYVILAAVFLAFFFIIFKVGSPLESLLLGPFDKLRTGLASQLGDGLLFHLAEGLIQGVGGGVAIVLPYFLPLLFLMSALEDFGYLARAGFLLDAFMHRIGLHGKSISPFILGFGCNVPAIVATRILESRRDRVLTALLIPFIPCSARTTIVLALVAFYLGPLWAMVFYAANILVVALVGWGLSRFMKEPSPGLILEIPSLKAPRLSSIGRKTWLHVRSFIRFAWPLLIGGSLVLSLLSYFRADRWINDVLAPLVVKGLGLPHELGVTLVFGFLRKELSLIMMLQALGVDYQHLMTVISREQIVVFTVFISFFIPCLSTLVMLWKEIGKKWAFLSVGLSIGVALALSAAVRLIL